MTDIKAGLELDRAVAEAIGWKRTEKKVMSNAVDECFGTTISGWWDGDEYMSCDIPTFSTELNSAFYAAEKVGLFHEAWLTQDSNTSQFNVCFDDSHGGPTYGETVAASTPALAICAAILKLQEAADV